MPLSLQFQGALPAWVEHTCVSVDWIWARDLLCLQNKMEEMVNQSRQGFHWCLVPMLKPREGNSHVYRPGGGVMPD